MIHRDPIEAYPEFYRTDCGFNIGYLYIKYYEKYSCCICKKPIKNVKKIFAFVMQSSVKNKYRVKEPLKFHEDCIPIKLWNKFLKIKMIYLLEK